MTAFARSNADATTQRSPAAVDGIAAGAAQVLGALGAGLAAAHDWRRLGSLSETGLSREGLERADLPRTLVRRHFG